MGDPADYIIDLGGEVIATGTPEEVARDERSYTGQFLRKVLKREGEAPAEPKRRNARGVAGRKKGWYNGL